VVKVAGPLFSMDASGTIGNAVTFSKWKGRPYARQRVIPSNPQTGPQVGIRAMMKFLAQEWKGLGAPAKASWVIRAAQTAISPFNAYCAYNINRWRSFKGPTQDDPAAESATTPAAPTTTPTGGIRQVQLSIADGAQLPDWGWLVYHSTVTGFTPAYSNLVAIVKKTASPTIYIHAGLAVGAHYYRIGGIMIDGKKGTLEAQTTANST